MEKDIRLIDDLLKNPNISEISNLYLNKALRILIDREFNIPIESVPEVKVPLIGFIQHESEDDT